MDVSKIIAEIDAKIVSLQHARSVLVSLNLTEGVSAPVVAPAPKRRGRPKGSKNATTATNAIKPAKKKRKRNLSPEGRKAISDALKRRWEERRKQEKK